MMNTRQNKGLGMKIVQFMHSNNISAFLVAYVPWTVSTVKASY